jgi:hypothetical protein
MKLLFTVMAMLFAVNLYAVLNSGAEVAIVQSGESRIKAVETQEVRKRWSPTMTFTPDTRQATATATATRTPSI